MLEVAVWVMDVEEEGAKGERGGMSPEYRQSSFLIPKYASCRKDHSLSVFVVRPP